MYDPKSAKGEEFINHEEILETLAFAQAHKADRAMIETALKKAEAFKGLTHREAAVLLACEENDLNDRIFAAAKKVKEHIYGNRIVLFAPLYLSNYCVNTCTYCPYHAKNKHIVRKKLTQEQIRQEVIALQDMGHKRLLLEAGDFRVHQHDLLHQAQKRCYSPCQYQYCGHNSGKLQKTS